MNQAAEVKQNGSNSDMESIGLMVREALSASSGVTSSWIVDSGATCHMCNNRDMFSTINSRKQPLEVA